MLPDQRRPGPAFQLYLGRSPRRFRMHMRWFVIVEIDDKPNIGETMHRDHKITYLGWVFKGHPHNSGQGG